MSWIRRSFITGFFVTVPLIISVAALVWIFQVVDGFTEPISQRLIGRAVPGLGVLITGGMILVVGALATNMIGKRVLQRTEYYLLHVPVFKTIRAGPAARRGIFTGQRGGVQESRHRRGSPPRHDFGLFDKRVHA